jgi:hypothetical protein
MDKVERVKTKLVRTTRDAILVVNKADKGVWLPFRMIGSPLNDARIGEEIEVVIPGWLARKEGLV